MKIIYMGTPDFAVPALSLIAEKHEVGYVLTQQDKPKNRGKKLQPTPVKEKALELGIEVLQPDKVKNNPELMETLAAYAPDAIVVAAYGKILPVELLELPKYGCFNIHASLLPRHRGAAPIQNCILLGDEKTGVTVMRMAEGLDTGNMILKAETEIGKKNGGQLHDELSEMGGKLIMEFLDRLESGEEIPEEVQDDALSCYAPMIFKKDGEIDFSQSAEVIERRTRALDPWPGAYTQYNGQPMKIWEAEVSDEASDKDPGTVLKVDNNGIAIATGKGTLTATVIQMPGKKRVAVKEYLKGNSIEEGTVLG